MEITSAATHKILTTSGTKKAMCSLGTPFANKGAKANPVKCARELLKTFKNCQNKRINELLTDDET